MKYFADGGPAQQVTQFQPTFSQQGIGSLQQEPDIPAMESSPTDYNQSLQYAPTTQYNTPAANPMTVGLDSYLKGLEYKAPVANSTGTVDSTNEYIYDPVTQTYRARPVVALGGEEEDSRSSVDSGGYGGDSGEKAGGRIHAYAHGGSTPQGIASLGRGPDTMLVHMTPGEVGGLQRLAMAHGGSLTINPQTGLPEAGFLSSMLPTLIGLGITAASGGTIPGWMIGAGVGGVTALTSGSLSKGLMAGLGAYGGSELAGGLQGVGAQQAEALKAADLSKAMVEATPTSGSAAADLAFKLDAIKNAPMEQATQEALARSPFQNSMQGIRELAGRGTGTAADAFKGLIGNAANEKTGVSASGLGGYPGAAKTLGMVAAPLISSAMNPSFNPPARNPTLYARYGDGRTPGYTPPKYNPATGNYDPAFYGPESFYTNPTQYGAKGGAVGYDEGGIARFYPLTGDQVSVGPAPGGLGGRGEKARYSREINDPDSGAGIFDNKAGEGPYKNEGGIHTNTPSGIKGLFAKTSAATLARYTKAKNAPMQAEATAELRRRAAAVDDYGDDTISAAQGGLMGTYAAGGKLLRGPGDGMSDSIPAVIQGQRPQRAALADGEFVIPADVVSHLGNGSTEAGSKRLYSMMSKIRKARTGNPKQGKQINPDRFMPA